MTSESPAPAGSRRLPALIVLGAVLGVFTGVFFGEYCIVLRPLGGAFVLLLQAPVYPYLICSLVHGVATLAPDVSLRLLKRAWPIFLLLWGATFVVLIVLGRTIPTPTPRLIDAAAAPAAQGNLLTMLIPSNVAESIVKNYVPAVVLFSLVFGAALQGVKNKQTMLELLEMTANASMKLWNWLLPLAPIGVFALVADTIGGFPVAALGRMGLYVLLFYIAALVVVLWMLPALAAGLTPIGWKELLAELRAPLLLAVGTSMPMVALPYLQAIARRLAARCNVQAEDVPEIAQTCNAISFALGQIGNGFLYLFILFAAFLDRHPLSTAQQWALPPVVLLAGQGTPSAELNAAAFLAEWLGLPADTRTLFVELKFVVNYGLVALSVMGSAFLTILAVLAYYGQLRLHPRRLAATLGPLALLGVGVVLAAPATAGLWSDAQQSRPGGLTLPPAVTAGVDVSEETAKSSTTEVQSATKAKSEDALVRILRTGVLRVGCDDRSAPFCYRNDAGQLVGLDVVAAYSLARTLNCRLEFIARGTAGLTADLENDRADLVVGGLTPDRDRLARLDLTRPYLLDRPSLLVRSDRRDEFLRMDQLQARHDLRLHVLRDTVPPHLSRVWFPKGRISEASELHLEDPAGEWDAVLAPRSRAELWASAYPGYTVVLPRDLPGRLPVLYLVRQDSPRFRDFLDLWVETQQSDGFFRRQEAVWLHGQSAGAPIPRWCILRDVLHWVR